MHAARRTWFQLALVLCSALTAACTTAPDPKKSETQEQPEKPVEPSDPAPVVTNAPLVVGYSALRISLPVLVAQSRGLFAAHGLNVELKRYETAQPLVEEVLDGRVLAGGYAALPIVFKAALAGDKRVHLVSALVEDSSHPVSFLLRRRGDAALQAIASLHGRRIGVLPTVAYQRWLAALLHHAGLESTDVSVVPLAPAQQVSGLAEGVVDALFTNDPMATTALATQLAESFGPAAPVTQLTGGALWFGSFLIHPSLVTTRPNDVQALAAALDQAIDYITAHQLEARQLLKPYVRPAEQAHVERYPNAAYLRSNQLDDARLADELANYVKLGILETAPPTTGWVWTPTAPQAMPAAVAKP